MCLRAKAGSKVKRSRRESCSRENVGLKSGQGSKASQTPSRGLTDLYAPGGHYARGYHWEQEPSSHRGSFLTALAPPSPVKLILCLTLDHVDGTRPAHLRYQPGVELRLSRLSLEFHCSRNCQASEELSQLCSHAFPNALRQLCPLASNFLGVFALLWPSEVSFPPYSCRRSFLLKGAVQVERERRPGQGAAPSWKRTNPQVLSPACLSPSSRAPQDVLLSPGGPRGR